MKLKPYYFLLLLVLFGCQNTTEIAFEPYTFENDSCADCPVISIALPKALGTSKIAKAINTALDEELIFQMSFDSEIEASTLDAAMQSFKKGYVALKELHTFESTPWEAVINGAVTYEDANYITIELDTYIFTGGAHGYSSKQLLNYFMNY